MHTLPNFGHILRSASAHLKHVSLQGYVSQKMPSII